MNKLIFLCLFLFSALVKAELSFEQLNDITSTPDQLSGQFNQEKYIADLAVSLKSSGHFSYQRDQVMHWQTMQPIEHELVMTRQTMTNRQGDNELIRLELNSNPSLQVISELFFSVLTAEWQGLAQYFKLSSASNNNGQWQAELLPIDTVIAQFANRVSLQGNSLLHEVTIYEKNGDYTKIQFDNLNQ